MSKLRTLVSRSDLKSLFENGYGKLNNDYRLAEVAMGPEGKADYDKGHIPNAIFFDLTKGVHSSKLYPKAIPDKKEFADYVGSLGISNKHHIIVYDRSPFGFLTASRLWWLFRLFGHQNVSVLNGGLTKWNLEENNSQSLSNEIPNYEPQIFLINYNQNMIRTYNDMVDNLEKKTAQVIDCRPNEDYKGIAPSKVPDGKLGHIPFSKNVPFTEIIDKSNTILKTKEDILNVFKTKGVDLNKPIIAHCLSSITACTVLLGAHECGYDNIPLYTGSWFEWSQCASDENCIKEDN